MTIGFKQGIGSLSRALTAYAGSDPAAAVEWFITTDQSGILQQRQLILLKRQVSLR